ncbi:uncharacterized protein LOC141637428 [Silene latifolia]|uniref:uncharacterized protein LOC141637428 n=1 Tax=Silene latifolia TaxID=37657 RepID=UPI003D76B9F9
MVARALTRKGTTLVKLAKMVQWRIWVWFMDWHLGLFCIFRQTRRGVYDAAIPHFELELCTEKEGPGILKISEGLISYTQQMLDEDREIWITFVLKHTQVEEEDATGVDQRELDFIYYCNFF